MRLKAANKCGLSDSTTDSNNIKSLKHVLWSCSVVIPSSGRDYLTQHGGGRVAQRLLQQDTW